MYKLKNLKSRAATAENKNAEAGAGGKAGGGRKGSPCISPLKQGETYTLLDTDGPGMVRHIWCTLPPGSIDHMRNVIIRMYWDHQDQASVEVPLGDFFGIAHGRQRNILSSCVTMQDGKGFNCWIPMPFQKHARITIENDATRDVDLFFYQVDFTLGDQVEEDDGYFHAQFRRANPNPLHEDYTIIDGVQGKGVYLGTVLGVRSLYRDAWWGEGELKFFLDGDGKYPTICGTGTEDYIGSAWGLEEIITPYQGVPLADENTGLYSIYRFHVTDPIYFQEDLKVTVQQIAYGSSGKAKEHFGEEYRGYRAAGPPSDNDFAYFDLSDDYCSTAYWYQSLPTAPFPALPSKTERSADLLEEQEGTDLKRSDI
ncbi:MULTISPECIES: glycoside hydrolase family 172 protein [Gracilibacillus]|uniref:glycoside hydrolase family 172 protein n=1 Tax=Gracilibacillus TaxID=74385 RepID=UPI0008265674|nr:MULTISPECIES: glycoside hydrolase family 172 protein [Gracilibacillus]